MANLRVFFHCKSTVALRIELLHHWSNVRYVNKVWYAYARWCFLFLGFLLWFLQQWCLVCRDISLLRHLFPTGQQCKGRHVETLATGGVFFGRRGKWQRRWWKEQTSSSHPLGIWRSLWFVDDTRRVDTTTTTTRAKRRRGNALQQCDPLALLFHTYRPSPPILSHHDLWRMVCYVLQYGGL